MSIATVGKRAFARMAVGLLKRNIMLESFLRWGEKQVLNELVIRNEHDRPIGSQQEKFIVVQNLMRSFERKLKSGSLSPAVRDWVFNTMISDVMMNWRDRHADAFKRRQQNEPIPNFITISPTQKCNLACIGCYAASSNKTAVTLDWDVVDRIMEQKRELWGSYFTVISGGEPLLYESQGKTILDLYEKHHDNFFLMYTNGTLIDRAMAKKLASLGNVAPAISVEGFEDETDYRRGKGVYRKILDAVEYLKEEGVIYGISFTATRKNVDRLLNDQFIDQFFGPYGASFGWMFQYMPMGRGVDFELMITPEQRRQLWHQERHLIHEKRVCFFDFWNGGPISDGCISAGRKGGYLYIDWHGNVMPCVFVPYTVGNIKKDFFDQRKNLDDVLRTRFFQSIRAWQKNYSYQKPAAEAKNEIVPCPIRDHHDEFHRIAEESGAVPVDPTTRKSFKDRAYVEQLTRIGKKVDELTRDIWVQEYQKR